MMGLSLDARGRRLRAALAAVLVRADAPELRLMHDWLDSWDGLGLMVEGMTHQGWDLQLTAYATRDLRANFFPVGIALHRRGLGLGADTVASGQIRLRRLDGWRKIAAVLRQRAQVAT
jgi:hypothetical protein